MTLVQDRRSGRNDEGVRLDDLGDVLLLSEIATVLRTSTRTIKRHLRAGTFPIPMLLGIDKLAANRKPRVTDDSPAFWARVMLVPFTVSFVGREDRDLGPALEQDPEHQAAVLTWIVQGAVRYYHQGLEPAAAVTTATDEYEQECDPIADFMNEACSLDGGASISASDAYGFCRQWAEQHGLSDRERLSATAFGRRMSDRFPHKKGRGGKVYRGLKRRDGGDV